VHLRARAVDAKAAGHRLPSAEGTAMRAAAFTMARPALWARALRAARLGRLLRGRRAVPSPLSAWTASRDLPDPPAEPLRDWWQREGRRR
jgi:L-lactate dehydrogenase complex protein LldF